MKYWVYKCNTRGESAGYGQWGDWGDVFDGSGGIPWGNVADIPDLARPKKGDRIISHQTDRHMLVGVADVLGLRKGELMLRAHERIGADMRVLKKKYASVAAIPAYQPGPIRSIYEISNADAERLVNLARASVASKANGRAKEQRRLAGALDVIAAVENEGAATGNGSKATNGAIQGFGLSPKERRAVERRAVELAVRHFQSNGWVVEDVGDSKASLDLLCRRNGVELHIEVKGTTGLGRQIILTKNEVQRARSYKHVALALVHGVALSEGKTPTAKGGKLLVRYPWKVVDKHLKPLAYYYEVA